MARARNTDLQWETLALPRNAIRGRERLIMPQVSSTAAVFLDISGYTPLAESVIKAHGERGVGLIVDVLERIFQPVAETALRYGGNVIAIEGDAMLITFDGISKALAFCGEVDPHRKKVVKVRGNEFPLQIDIGLAEGNLYEFIAKDGARRAYLSCGSALREAGRLEKLSKNGSVASNIMRDVHGKSLDETMKGAELHRNFLSRRKGVIERLFGRKAEAAPAPEPEYLASFQHEGIMDQPVRLLWPAIIFSDFPLIRLAFSKVRPRDGSAPDPILARDALNRFFAGVRHIVEDQAEGYIGKFKDENSMFLIGAPKTCEDARVRAFEAVARMHDLHARLCMEYRLPKLPAVSGMHKGPALCGPMMGRFDTIGESVNLASRIKASVYARKEAPERRKIRYSREMLDERVSRMIKGFEVERAHLAGVEDTKTLFFDFSTQIGFGAKEEHVLRKNELEALCAIARGCCPNHGRAVNVIGGVGSGKDRLLSLVASQMQDEMPCFEVRCSPMIKKDPYRALFELMKKSQSLYSDDELFESAGGKPSSAEGFSDMLARFRKALLSRPSLYVMNNGDNMDEESAAFLRELAPSLIEAGCCAMFSGNAALFPGGEDVEMKDLPRAEATAFARSIAAGHHPDALLPEGVMEEVFQKSGGNPLFISELVKAMEEDGFGRLILRRDLPQSLSEIMLRNIGAALTPGLQETLAEYSLMHSIAIMAPLLDNEAELNMAILRDKGFLGPDFEFASDMLHRAVSLSMDPRRKAEVCGRLAEAAEAAGMREHLAIFGYYRGAERTKENRARALRHAESHIMGVAFFYLVRNDFFDDAVEIADLTDEQQRKICGNMLHRKAYLVSKLGNDIRTMEKRLEILEEALEYLEGTGEDYKALAQMAATKCRLGGMLLSERGDEGGAKGMMAEGKRLYLMARDEALRAGRVDAFLNISNSCAGALTVFCREPAWVLGMLEETEKRLAQLPQLQPTNQNLAYLAMLDKMYAEAAKDLGRYDFALEKLASGLEKSEKAGYAQGVLYCRATEAQVYSLMGRANEARGLAQECISYMKGQGLEDAEVKADMDQILHAR